MSNRTAFANTYHQDASLRLTWQAAAKHKIVGSYSIQPNCSCTYGLIGVGSPAPSAPKPAPEALDDHHYNPNYLPLVSWSYPATNRLLFEAGASAIIMTINTQRLPETGPTNLAITDLATNSTWGSRARPYVLSFNKQYQQRFAMSYITGSHAFKTGVDLQEIVHSGGENRFTDPEQDHRRPGLHVPEHGAGLGQDLVGADRDGGHTQAVGIFAQDQWTVKKTDAQPRPALRHVQRVGSRATSAGGPVRAGARLSGGVGHAELEESQPAAGRCATICSATAGPRSRCRWAGTCRIVTAAPRSTL